MNTLYFVALLLFALGLAARIAMRNDPRPYLVTAVSLSVTILWWLRVSFLPLRDEGPGVLAMMVTLFALGTVAGEVWFLVRTIRRQDSSTAAKRRAEVLLAVLALAAAILFLQRPHSFQGAMGKDYQPDQIQRVSVSLISVSGPEQYSVTLTPESQDFEYLMILLGNQSYHRARDDGYHQSATGYQGMITFHSSSRGVPRFSFYGDTVIETDTGAWTASGGIKFQQDLVNFVLGLDDTGP